MSGFCSIVSGSSLSLIFLERGDLDYECAFDSLCARDLGVVTFESITYKSSRFGRLSLIVLLRLNFLNMLCGSALGDWSNDECTAD